MGWNYVMSWAVTLPLELTVCGTVIQYWAPDTSVAIWVTVSFDYRLSLLGNVCTVLKANVIVVGIPCRDNSCKRIWHPWLCRRGVLGSSFKAISNNYFHDCCDCAYLRRWTIKRPIS